MNQPFGYWICTSKCTDAKSACLNLNGLGVGGRVLPVLLRSVLPLPVSVCSPPSPLPEHPPATISCPLCQPASVSANSPSCYLDLMSGASMCPSPCLTWLYGGVENALLSVCDIPGLCSKRDFPPDTFLSQKFLQNHLFWEVSLSCNVCAWFSRGLNKSLWWKYEIWNTSDIPKAF